MAKNLKKTGKNAHWYDKVGRSWFLAHANKYIPGAFLVVLVVAAILLYQNIYLISQRANATSQLNSASGTLNTTHASYIKTQNQLNATLTALSSLQKSYYTLNSSYTALNAKFSKPYTKTIYTNHTVTLPAATKGGAVPGQYSFTYNALYDGYIVFNATRDSGNAWEVLATYQNSIILGKNTSFQNLPAFYYPINGQNASAIIPVYPGNMHVYIWNYETSATNIIYSAKYFGDYTSNVLP